MSCQSLIWVVFLFISYLLGTEFLAERHYRVTDSSQEWIALAGQNWMSFFAGKPFDLNFITK